MEQDILNKVLVLCQKYVGTKESPPNSNNVIFNTRFYGKEVNDLIDPTHQHPWCGASVSEIYQEALAPLGTIDYLRGFASVPYAIEHVDKWGKIVPKEQAKPGYVVMYKFKNRKGIVEWAHTGILKSSIIAPGIFDAYEGNTGIGNDSNGGEYMVRHRNWSADTVLFIRPNCLDK